MSETNRPLPDGVRRAFGLRGPAEPLPGGTGQSMRVGDVVLKPGADERASWYAEVLAALPQQGFRVPSPVPATDGRWVVDGWTATSWVAGETGPQGRWGELLAAARAFHAALADVSAPDVLAEQHHPWAIADRVAWGEVSIPLPAAFRPTYDALVDARRSLSDAPPAQLVHGDLSGNVLFAPGLDPAVIDFSPYWRPVGYAEAVVAVDALTWHGAPTEEVLPLLTDRNRRQLLIRAALFRFVAFAQLAAEPGTEAVAGERDRFDHTVATVLATS